MIKNYDLQNSFDKIKPSETLKEQMLGNIKAKQNVSLYTNRRFTWRAVAQYTVCFVFVAGIASGALYLNKNNKDKEPLSGTNLGVASDGVTFTDNTAETDIIKQVYPEEFLEQLELEEEANTDALYSEEFLKQMELEEEAKADLNGDGKIGDLDAEMYLYYEADTTGRSNFLQYELKKRIDSGTQEYYKVAISSNYDYTQGYTTDDGTTIDDIDFENMTEEMQEKYHKFLIEAFQVYMQEVGAKYNISDIYSLSTDNGPSMKRFSGLSYDTPWSLQFGAIVNEEQINAMLADDYYLADWEAVKGALEETLNPSYVLDNIDLEEVDENLAKDRYYRIVDLIANWDKGAYGNLHPEYWDEPEKYEFPLNGEYFVTPDYGTYFTKYVDENGMKVHYSADMDYPQRFTAPESLLEKYAGENFNNLYVPIADMCQSYTGIFSGEVLDIYNCAFSTQDDDGEYKIFPFTKIEIKVNKSYAVDDRIAPQHQGLEGETVSIFYTGGYMPESELLSDETGQVTHVVKSPEEVDEGFEKLYVVHNSNSVICSNNLEVGANFLFFTNATDFNAEGGEYNYVLPAFANNMLLDLGATHPDIPDFENAYMSSGILNVSTDPEYALEFPQTDYLLGEEIEKYIANK
ncbi:MAG: hypothetical protein LBM93_15675 [Oscillospiraceae bacterium]|nr:hypothetical protein [Oscillospiraceae bacterium]